MAYAAACTYTLCDVLYVPGLQHNVLPVSKLTSMGLQLVFAGKQHGFEAVWACPAEHDQDAGN